MAENTQSPWTRKRVVLTQCGLAQFELGRPAKKETVQIIVPRAALPFVEPTLTVNGPVKYRAPRYNNVGLVPNTELVGHAGDFYSLLAEQFKGAEIQVELKTGGTTVTGKITNLSQEEQNSAGGVVTNTIVWLLKEGDQFEQVNASQIKGLKFTDAALQSEYRRFLDVQRSALPIGSSTASVDVEPASEDVKGELGVAYIGPMAAFGLFYEVNNDGDGKGTIELKAVVHNNSGTALDDFEVGITTRQLNFVLPDINQAKHPKISKVSLYPASVRSGQAIETADDADGRDEAMGYSNDMLESTRGGGPEMFRAAAAFSAPKMAGGGHRAVTEQATVRSAGNYFEYTLPGTQNIPDGETATPSVFLAEIGDLKSVLYCAPFSGTTVPTQAMKFTAPKNLPSSNFVSVWSRVDNIRGFLGSAKIGEKGYTAGETVMLDISAQEAVGVSSSQGENGSIDDGLKVGKGVFLWSSRNFRERKYEIRNPLNEAFEFDLDHAPWAGAKVTISGAEVKQSTVPGSGNLRLSFQVPAGSGESPTKVTFTVREESPSTNRYTVKDHRGHLLQWVRDNVIAGTHPLRDQQAMAGVLAAVKAGDDLQVRINDGTRSAQLKQKQADQKTKLLSASNFDKNLAESVSREAMELSDAAFKWENEEKPTLEKERDGKYAEAAEALKKLVFEGVSYAPAAPTDDGDPMAE